MRMKSISIAVVCSVLLVLAGCGSEDDGDSSSGGTGGGAGSNGTAGMNGGGTGGGASGTGGGAGGTGGGDGAPAGCSAAVAGDPAALHMAAAEVLTSTTTCGFGSCHIDEGRADLVLVGVTDLNAALVDKPSCFVPSVPLVASGGGDAALENSWLWLKFVAPADTTGVITPQAEWGTPATTCDAQGGQPVGVRMPYGTPGSSYASEARLAAVRNWICAGAPGPM